MDLSGKCCDNGNFGDAHHCQKQPESFVTKDSGKREEFVTGMVRDTQDDKPRYDLVWKPGLKRLAELMTRGSVKYGARNWEKASTTEELERFRSSANRHFEQWMLGEKDEDHMAATVFNLFGAEFVQEKLKNTTKENACKTCDGTEELPF